MMKHVGHGKKDKASDLTPQEKELAKEFTVEALVKKY
jgi:hypothetical protein